MDSMTDSSKGYGMEYDNASVDSRMEETPMTTSFHEIYAEDGSSWITMKIKTMSLEYNIDFDSPEQVRKFYDTIGSYLRRRGTFRMVDPDSQAAEPQCGYD